jgi:hypothetical protein
MSFQPGQNILSPIGQARIPADNGGAQTAAINVHSGSFVLNGATPVTVADANLTANSNVIISLKTVGGTVGAQPHLETVTPGTGFTVQGTASDTSTYNYLIVG